MGCFRHAALGLALIFGFVIFVQHGRAQSAGGIAATAISVRYPPVAFPQLVQLNDFSAIALTLTSVDASGNSLTYSLVSGPTFGSLGAFDPTAGTVAYTPLPGSSANDTFTFSVTDGVLSSNMATVTIFPPEPTAGLSANALDLGSQLKGASSATQTVSINNTSVASLNISSVSIAGANPADFALTSGGSCPSSGLLSAHASCTLTVVFTPVATGARSATLNISDNALDSPQNVTLTGTGTDFSFAPVANGSTSQTITEGQTATYNLQINSTNGFSGQVSMSCSGAPSLSTCTISPTVVNVSGASTPFTVNVTTTAPAASAAVWKWGPGANPFCYTLAACGLFFVLGIASIKARVRILTQAATVTALLLLNTSCSGNGAGPLPTQPQPGTPQGTYTLSVSGTANGATKRVPLMLTVQ